MALTSMGTPGLQAGDTSQVIQSPPFTFPVVAWAPEPATGDITDDGVREFLSGKNLATIYFLDDLRRGWTFVDVEGRCWEVVDSKVAGRAEAWWIRLLPSWVWTPQYRLAMDFVERPPMSFDAVKSRLFAAVTANPKRYSGHASYRRSELRRARSLRDLIKSAEERAIEYLRPEPLWSQWLGGDGRCSRRAFLAAWVGIAAALWFDVVLAVPMPWLLIIIIGAAAVAMSTIFRRLHDIGRSGFWIMAWFALSTLCGLIYDYWADAAVRTAAARIWQLSTAGALVYLMIAPGTRGANRFGFGRRQSNRSP